jgi:hypothetical protein
MITPDVYSVLQRIPYPNDSHFGFFDVSGQTIRIASPASETIESLRSFFNPYIESHDETYSASSFHDLHIIVDPHLYDYLKANVPKSPDDLLATALTHDLEYQLRCFYSESREIKVIEDEPLKLFYVVSSGGRSTKVIATAGSRTRTALLRMIRSAWVLTHDALIVHGSVLEKDGRGIVIAGEKHAGKTTTLLNLCTRKNYDIVANDRLLLKRNPADQRLRAIGIPTVINLRWNTVKPFPELQHLIDIPLFGVQDLAKALDVSVKSEVDVTAVAFLSYDKDCRQPVFRSLSEEESYEMLTSHLFSTREYDWVRMMNIGEAIRDRVAVEKRDILNGVSSLHLTSNETHLEELAFLLDNWCQVGSIPIGRLAS